MEMTGNIIRGKPNEPTANESTLRPVSSMLTFPLRYNFPPLSMRITSWIVKKKSAYAEKVVRKKVELQATFFVHLVRSLINL